MSQPGFAGNSYIVDINGDAGAFVAIVARSTVRRLVIEESSITSGGAANALQGVLDYQIPNDGTANGFTTIFRAQQEPIKLPDGADTPSRMYQGEIIGQLGQPIVGNNPPGLTTATTMVKVRSGSATATSVKVTEYN